MNDTDATTIQWLNLLHGSPSFIIRIDPRTSTPTVVQVEVVPDDDGVYWIAGTTTLPRGDVLPSVFQVDTAAGGSLLGVHWKIHGRWMSSSDRTQVLAALDAGEGDMFPFNWTYVVPLARNVYLDGTGASEGTA